MDLNTRIIRNGVINDCFKDPADKDYILARAAWRLKLTDQYLWSLLQAFEKYFKAILLYHDVSTKNLGHDLTNILKRIEHNIPNIISFDDKDKILFDELTLYGGDRYFGFTRSSHGFEIMKVDAAIWYVRMYCQDFNILDHHEIADGLPSYDEYLNELRSNDTIKDAIRFRPLINSGHLEDILDKGKNANQRNILVWKNRYFGSRCKGRITVPDYWEWRKPTHFHHPVIFPWAEKLIYFNNNIKEYFDNLEVES